MKEPIRTSRSPGYAADPFGEQSERRKQRLMALLSKGLPTLPAYLLDLNALLGSSMVDLKKVGKVIRTDPSLTAQVLRLCNSALFGLRRRVLSIEQAAVLLGTERLRTLVLTCSVMQFAGKNVPMKSLLGFWQHSFLSALLSERIARLVEYTEKEQAYLAGLLHDIGQLPLWMVLMEEQAKGRPLPPVNWADNLPLEREYFGMDHGKVGRWMAVSWNFMPSFLDVFEHHHDPENAQHDPYLVGIVSAADQFLQTITPGEGEVLEANIAAEAAGVDPRTISAAGVSPGEGAAAAGPGFLLQCFPRLGEEERSGVLEMLQTEYLHVLPLVELSMAAIAPEQSGGSTSGQELKREQATSTYRG
jgi:HD-like signal output (HDOD) protein